MADALLATQAIVTDAGSRERLIGELAKATTQAAVKLRANANGDYRPDPNAGRFPAWEGIARKPAAASQTAKQSTTLDDLFERWRREREPAPSTVTTWRGYVRQLKKHLGHSDPSRVTKADIVAWKDALIAAGHARKGIKDGQLAAAKALFAYAVENDLMSVNTALRTGSETSGNARAISGLVLIFFV